MSKLLKILLFLLFINSAFGQNETLENNFGCGFVNNKKDSIVPWEIFKIINCIIQKDQFGNAMKLLDSLIGLYPEKAGMLFFIKASCSYENNIYDTTYITCIKQSIKLNYALDASIYNLALYYYSFVDACEKKESPIVLKQNEKLFLLNLSEEIFNKYSMINKSGKIDALRAYIMIKRKRDEITCIKPKELLFSNKFDTLLIITQLNDCGEFGGHLEYIKIYHSENEIFGTLTLDSIYCQQNIKPLREFDINFKKEAQKIDSTSIINFIQYLKSIKKEYYYTTAMAFYWIYIDSELYYINNWIGESGYYISFRNKIFK